MNIQGCRVFHSFIPCFCIYLFKLFTIIFLLLIFYYDRAGSCSGPGLVALWQCGILVTCPGIGPAWRVGWTTGEVPSACLLSAHIGSALWLGGAALSSPMLPVEPWTWRWPGTHVRATLQSLSSRIPPLHTCARQRAQASLLTCFVLSKYLKICGNVSLSFYTLQVFIFSQKFHFYYFTLLVN